MKLTMKSVTYSSEGDYISKLDFIIDKRIAAQRDRVISIISVLM